MSHSLYAKKDAFKKPLILQDFSTVSVLSSASKNSITFSNKALKLFSTFSLLKKIFRYPNFSTKKVLLMHFIANYVRKCLPSIYVFSQP